MLAKTILVALLVPLLGDRDFQTRVTTEKLLIQANKTFDLRREIEPYRAHPDPEVRQRIDRIETEYRAVWFAPFPRYPIFLEVQVNMGLITVDEALLLIQQLTNNEEEYYDEEDMTMRAVEEMLNNGVSRDTVITILVEATRKQNQQ